jgi:hypothetical protein
MLCYAWEAHCVIETTEHDDAVAAETKARCATHVPMPCCAVLCDALLLCYAVRCMLCYATKARFFRVVSTFGAELRSRTLAFATALARLPAGGFESLAPPFRHERAQHQHGIGTATHQEPPRAEPLECSSRRLQLLGDSWQGRLPVAHTCFNTLQVRCVLGLIGLCTLPGTHATAFAAAARAVRH